MEYEIKNYLSLLGRNIKKLKWKNICNNQFIPLWFYQRHIKHIDWPSICTNPNIPIEFYEKHIDKLRIDFLVNNPTITQDFFEKYVDRMIQNLFEILKFHNYSSFHNEFHKDKIIRGLLRHDSVTYKFVYEHFTKEESLIKLNHYRMSCSELGNTCRQKIPPIEHFVKYRDMSIDEYLNEKSLDLEKMYDWNEENLYHYFNFKIYKETKIQKYNQIRENKNNLILDINNHIGLVPPGVYKHLPDGGPEFIKVVKRYDKKYLIS